MTPEDLRFRKDYIGASDAPIIMEKSPWATPYELWRLKVGLDEDPQGNYATREGLRNEPIARKEFEKLTGLCVFPERRFSADHEFMMASLDGISLDGKHAVEIKCPGQADHEMALNGIIPEKYYPQLQHQICVLNLEMIFYFSFNGKENKIIEVERNNDYISMLVDKEAEFFQSMKKLVAPPLTDKDFQYNHEEKYLEKVSRYLALQPYLDEHEQLRKELIAMCNDRNTIGGGLKLTKVIRKGAIDYSSIPYLENLDLEAFRKGPVESWRITSVN